MFVWQLNRLSHISIHLKELGRLKTSIVHCTAVQMIRVRLFNKIRYTTDAHNRGLRVKTLLHIPKLKTKLLRHSFNSLIYHEVSSKLKKK